MESCLFHYGQGILDEPEAMAVYGTEILVLDTTRVVVFDRETGDMIRSFGEGIVQSACGICVNQGMAWITDPEANCVFIFE